MNKAHTLALLCLIAIGLVSADLGAMHEPSARAGEPASARDGHFLQAVVKLPVVDRIVLETIPGIRLSTDKSFTPRSVTLVGADARRVARLWRRLRQGDPALCYYPGHRVTFFSKGKAIAAADVCFACDKMQIDGAEGIVSIGGNKRVRNELERLFRKYLGE